MRRQRPVRVGHHEALDHLPLGDGRIGQRPQDSEDDGLDVEPDLRVSQDGFGLADKALRVVADVQQDLPDLSAPE
jgi:hypothetical protein